MVWQVSKAAIGMAKDFPKVWNESQTVLGCCGWNLKGSFLDSCMLVVFVWVLRALYSLLCRSSKKHFIPYCLLYLHNFVDTAGTTNATAENPFNHGIEPCSVLF